MMTQNELNDLVPNIERALPYVDSVTIVDGGSVDGTIMYFRNWQQQESKIRFFIHPWKDDFPAQRNNYLKRVAEIAKAGDWVAMADPDEYYEQATWEKIHKAIDKAESLDKNMIGLRCRGVSNKGSDRVWENLDDYWKELIVKWDPKFRFNGFRCHEGKEGIPHLIMRTNLVYEHIKQENVIWIRGARNMFHAGSGPNLGEKNPAWVKLRNFTKETLNIDDWHSYYSYLLKGNIDPWLKSFFVDHMLEGTPEASDNAVSKDSWDGSSEMREMYKMYFRILHPEEEPDELKSVHIP
jgi:glycosyltransferase involved in cell wall biosynthesis